MIELVVNVRDLGASDGIGAVIRACRDRAKLHDGIRARTETYVKEHLQDLNDSRSPNIGYFGAAARSVESKADEKSVRITIPHIGMALHYYGGHVEPGKSISSFTGKPTRALALPTKSVPILGGGDTARRARPADVGILAFLPGRKGADGTVGYLIEGEEKEITRGKNKGGKRNVPRKDGRLMFVLRSWTDHNPDTTVIPTLSDLIECSKAAASEYISTYKPNGPIA